MAEQEYWNTYHQKPMIWDPETGGSFIIAAFGQMASPQSTKERGLAQLALYHARYPEETINLFHAPCMFKWATLPSKSTCFSDSW